MRDLIIISTAPGDISTTVSTIYANDTVIHFYEGPKEENGAAKVAIISSIISGTLVVSLIAGLAIKYKISKRSYW